MESGGSLVRRMSQMVLDMLAEDFDGIFGGLTRTQLFNLGGIAARIEVLLEDFHTICFHDKRGCDFLLLLALALEIEFDFAASLVERNINLVHFDRPIASTV